MKASITNFFKPVFRSSPSPAEEAGSFFDMRYKHQLQTESWKQKAFEIKKRDNFTCQGCLEQTKTLHVHHKTYVYEWKAWEYPDEYLITLCEDCHLQAHDWIDRIDIAMEGLMVNVEPLQIYSALIQLKRNLNLSHDEHEIKDRIIKKRLHNGQ